MRPHWEVSSSRSAPAFQFSQESAKLFLLNTDKMAFFRTGAGTDVENEFEEGGDALLLQAVIFCGEVAVSLGVARIMAAIGAEHDLDFGCKSARHGVRSRFFLDPWAYPFD